MNQKKTSFFPNIQRSARRRSIGSVMGSLLVASTCSAAWADQVTIGFATAQSGFMVGFDGDAQKMAQLWIKDRNAAGGLLGKPIDFAISDTKSDRIEGARAGQTVVDAGADLVVVSCDYDFGSPAAGAAERAGKISVFLCAEDPKAGVQGVGPLSYTTSVAAHVQGAVMARWANEKLGVKRPYVLLDTMTEYDKSLCAGFRWAVSETKGMQIVGEDTFLNDDPSIQSQITRLATATEKPDAIMLCSYVPGGASALRQIRAAGVELPILGGSAMDGSYWTDAVPGLKDFYLPVAASVHGDDPRAEINSLNERYKAAYGSLPATTYGYPIYAFLDLWVRAVEKTGSTDGSQVAAALDAMKDEKTFIGPRSFSPQLHIQTNAEMLILSHDAGKVHVADRYSLPSPLPQDVLFGRN